MLFIWLHAKTKKHLKIFQKNIKNMKKSVDIDVA